MLKAVYKNLNNKTNLNNKKKSYQQEGRGKGVITNLKTEDEEKIKSGDHGR